MTEKEKAELRDQFAIHAPAPDPEWIKKWCDQELGRSRKDPNYVQRGLFEALAAWSWNYADTMIKTREEEQSVVDEKKKPENQFVRKIVMG